MLSIDENIDIRGYSFAKEVLEKSNNLTLVIKNSSYPGIATTKSNAFV
jgi:hypothetical protein